MSGDRLVGVLLNYPRFATHIRHGGEVFAESGIVVFDGPLPMG